MGMMSMSGATLRNRWVKEHILFGGLNLRFTVIDDTLMYIFIHILRHSGARPIILLNIYLAVILVISWSSLPIYVMLTCQFSTAASLSS